MSSMWRMLGLGFLAAWLAVSQRLEPIGEIQQALQKRDFSRALATADVELKRLPREPALWTLRGMALAGLGREAESIAAYRQALKLRPNFLPALERTAEIEYGKGDPGARTTLERIVALRPDSAAANGMLAALAYERGDCETAAAHFGKVGAPLQANRAAIDQFGDCLTRLKRPSEAAALFRQVLASHPDDRQARYNLGVCLLEAKQPAEARAALMPLAQREVPESEELTLLAEASREADDIAGAIETLRRATKLYPREPRHYLDLATIAIDHESFDLGLEIVNVGIAKLPQSAPLYAMRGVLYVFTAHLDKAEADFSQATQLAPEDASGRLALGVALLSSEKLDEAIHVLREQVRANPKEARAQCYLAQALLRKADQPGTPEFEEATTALDAALRQLPGLARAHYMRAKILVKLGQQPEAIRELERTIALDPGDRSATYQLLLIYSRQGRTEEAARLKERVRTQLVEDREAQGARKNVRLTRTP
jgi:tetratricopeptide (TPR) repeat protein